MGEKFMMPALVLIYWQSESILKYIANKKKKGLTFSMRK